MNKLKLNLVIVGRSMNLATGIRVFDRKSFEAAVHAVRSGLLGRHSKSSFHLQGQYMTSDGEWEAIVFPLFRKLVDGRQIADHPRVLDGMI